jgi:hypothetical protein
LYDDESEKQDVKQIILKCCFLLCSSDVLKKKIKNQTGMERAVAFVVVRTQTDDTEMYFCDVELTFARSRKQLLLRAMSALPKISSRSGQPQ